MDVLQMFLFCVIAVNVLVSLIIECHDSSDERNKGCDRDEIEPRIEEEAGKEENSKNSGEEIAEGVSCTELGNRGEEFGDDWQGIERTELEKVFGEAIVFCNNNGDQIGDLTKELYGLEQVVLQGPCHVSQPMAFNFLARSKWGAWKKLGDMSCETAMEKYVEILSKAIPKWKDEGKTVIQDATVIEDQRSLKQDRVCVEDERSIS